MLCKITNAGWESKDLFVIQKHSLSWTRISFPLQVLLKQPEGLVEYIEKLAEWVELCSYCLIRNFPRFFGSLLLMEPIIIFEGEFLFSNSSDLILTSWNVSTTRSTLWKFLGIEVKKYFKRLCKLFRNIVDTWSDLCHHINNVCVQVFGNDFFILNILSGIIHSTSLLSEDFLIKPSRWAKHKGAVYERYLSASLKLISPLALIDNNNNFAIRFLFGAISFMLVFIFRVILFPEDLNEGTLFL